MQRQCIDLFSGLAGFSLAALANGVRVVAQVEKDKDCLEFLKRTWPEANHYDEINSFTAKPYRGIWLVCGGPPCQPASRAGEQRGESDDRWLWPPTIRVVEEAQPTWFLFENPPGILDVGLDGIISDLERRGYEVQPISIPACAVNSPQDRERIWILGHRNGVAQGHAAGERRERCDANLYETTRRIGHEQTRGSVTKPTQSEFVEYGEASGRERLPGQASGRREGENRSDEPVESIALAGGQSGGQPVCGGASGQNGLGVFQAEGVSLANSECSASDGRTDEQGEGAEGRTVIGRDAEIGDVADGQIRPGRGGLCEAQPTQEWRRRLSDNSFRSELWSEYDWLLCPDSSGAKVRRAPIDLYDLADGVSPRLLAALGNAVVWPVAAEIIAAMIHSETVDAIPQSS